MCRHLNISGSSSFRFTAVAYIESTKYVESPKSGGQKVNTGYVPTLNTRIVADFNPLAKNGDGLAFFGATKDDDISSGVLFRYSDSGSIYGWFCNDSATAARFEGLENKRVMAELKAGSITLNGTTVPLATKGTPCGVSIFIFCHNDGGTWARRLQAMRLYSFRIFEGEESKRHFVPCVEMTTFVTP